ncbi:hypothetical protein [Salinicola aestuarinus]|uniref:hypothetical protein n=1 Tax=Salinicola aestuarinus TaxID=1949082 RepID=UPI000DA1D794|nr:hypothetical protein [Salinicola aestuarinus]
MATSFRAACLSRRQPRCLAWLTQRPPALALPRRAWPLIALLLGLLIAGGAAAQDAPASPDQPAPWPAADIEQSQRQCRANLTATGIEGPKVERYCSCVSESLEARFTPAEVRKMQREHDPGDDEETRPPKLAKALNQCAAVLESQ